VKVEDRIIVGGVLQSGAMVSIRYRGGVSRGTNLFWEFNGTEGDLPVTSMAGHAQALDTEYSSIRSTAAGERTPS
jgi:hypothetical protein